ncbi:hypothetical protein [Chlorobium phaeobacteroides]|nr:hypothetical protein [Chlorobium phaeobacteroides]
MVTFFPGIQVAEINVIRIEVVPVFLRGGFLIRDAGWRRSIG